MKSNISFIPNPEETFTKHLVTILYRLTKPAASIQQPEQQRRVRLLSALLLPAMFFTWISFPFASGNDRSLIVIISIILAIAYAFSRTKFHKLGALLIVGVSPLPVLANVFTGYNEAGVLLTLIWLAIPFLMGSMWLSAREIGVVASVGLDVTESKQAEEELRQNEERYRTILENIQDGYHETDLAGNEIFFNDTFCEITGYSREEAMGLNYRAFMDDETSKQVYETFNRIYKTGEPVKNFAYQILTKNGARKFVEVSASLIKNSENKPTGFRGILRDITERKQIEAEQQKSKDFLDSVLDTIDDPMFVKDEEHRWVMLNNASCKMIGYPKEKLLGKSDYEFFPKEQADVFWEKDQLVFDTEEANINEEEITWQGEVHTISTKKSIYKDPVTGKKFIVGIARDLTERKQIELEIRQRAAQLALINDIGSRITVVQELDNVLKQATRLVQVTFNYHHVAIFLIEDRVLKLKAVSGAYESFFPAGHIQKLNQGINGWVATHGEKIVANNIGDEPRFISLIGNNSITKSEICLPIQVDGQTVGVINIQSPQINAFGKNDVMALETLTGQIAVAIKNTRLVDRIQQELAERRRAEQRFKNLFEEAPAMYVITQNQNGAPLIADCNGLFLKTVGYTRAEVIGQPLANFYSAESQAKLFEGGYQQALEGSFVADERQLITRDGRVIDTLLHVSVETDAEGRVTGTRAMFSDTTQLKQTETALQQAKETAEAASKAKSEFLANMSHEIRTPMNGIIGMTDLTLDTDLNPIQREYLQMVKSSADSLLTIINDILDFSKIEAGKLDLAPIEFNLRDMLGNTMQTLALRAHEKALELAYHVPPNVPDGLVGDSGRLRQIILNLVGNAIKFTQQGEVVLYVDVESQTAGEVCLHFAVTDTGIGIPPEKQKSIFDAFSQADGSTTRQFGGTGLGLTISSQLTRLMGGRIWVESEPGSGSTFHFTACMGVHHKQISALTIQVENLKALPVLIVDDNATNRRILVEMLTNWKMKPTAVDGGPAALLELKQAVAAGQPFSLILLDAMMPEMDGFTLAEQIRDDPTLIEATVMMLSSADRPGDVARCRQLGIHTYLTKPITQSGLLNAIMLTLDETYFSEKETDKIVAQSAPVANPQQLHILLAEDNRVNQRLAIAILQKQGHTVVVANNGQEALDALERQTFDLVLMDVQMPILDGFEATAAIRAKEQQTNTHIPIIAMTAHAMTGDRERCLAAGMDGYVAKPIQPQALAQAIENIPLPAPQQQASESPQAPCESCFDWSEALERIDGDMEFLRELVDMFLDEAPTLLSQIEEAAKNYDGERLQRTAHQLKGAMSNFGAKDAIKAAQTLETLGAKRDFANAETEYRTLQNEISRFKQASALLKKEYSLA